MTLSSQASTSKKKSNHILEAYQHIYKAKTPKIFEQLLTKWYFWEIHSRMTQMVKAARRIKNHWQGVLNWAYQQTSNRLLEGFHSIFQAAKSKAREYRRLDTIREIIYLLTGKFDFFKDQPVLRYPLELTKSYL